jgi:hypothetical protein
MKSKNRIIANLIFLSVFWVNVAFAQDTWTPTSTTNAPDSRAYQTATPSGFSLSQNYQYPFTIIKFQVTKQENIKLTIVNEFGQEVITIFNKQFKPGGYEIKLDATDMGSGVYFCKISTPSFSETQKLMSI